MVTVLKLGPADHGRPMCLEEFLASDCEEGYKYELIDGRLYVSPEPNAPEGLVESWILRQIWRYIDERPDILNWAHCKTRVFVPGRRRVTCPEPDVSAYNNFPLHLPWQQVRYQDASPVLVVEVLSGDDPDKDLVRNVELYLQVPTIREYWVLDARANPEHPSLRVHRRRGRKWRIFDLAPGETYTTGLLPGFELVLDPRRWRYGAGRPTN